MLLVYSYIIYFLEIQNFFNLQSQFWFLLIARLTNTYLNLFLIILGYSLFTKNRTTNLLFFIFIKFKYLTLNYIQLKITTQLIVGYNVIHPVLFYTSFIFYLTKLKTKNVIFFLQNKYLLQICLLALVLGGWWGFGNSVWGFFWVNDLIEVILMVLFLQFTLNCHIPFFKKTSKYLWIFIFSLILLLIFLRFGFIFTRHNFFNLKTLNNLIVLFTIQTTMTFVCIPVICFFTQYVYIGFYVLFNYFLSFFIQLQRYKTSYILIHVVFFVVLISWLKYKSNLYTVFSLLNWQIVTQVYITVPYIFLKNKILWLYTVKFSMLQLSYTFLYNFKFLFLNYIVIASYSYVILLFCFLISILKIYFK